MEYLLKIRIVVSLYIVSAFLQFDINKTTRPKAYFGFCLVLACLCKQCRLRSSERRFLEFEKIRISENFGFRARYQSVEFRQTFVKMHVGSNTSAGM